MYVVSRGRSIWTSSSIAFHIYPSLLDHNLAIKLYSPASRTIIGHSQFGSFCGPQSFPRITIRKNARPIIQGSTHAATIVSQAMERNGEVRNKRKKSPVTALERPTKQLKPEISSFVDDDDETPANGNISSPGSEAEVSRLQPITAAIADSAEWQATIEKVVRNVVSIHFCQTCSFDTDAATSSEATGFVVDAEKGYILTNRHVVCAGPFWGYCIFDNHEEARGSTPANRL